MKIIQTLIISLFFVTLINYSSSIMIPRVNPLTFDIPPHFKIDLNTPARERWVPIANLYKPELLKFITLVEEFVPIPNTFYQLIGLWGKNLFQYNDYVLEVQGIADAIGVSFDRVFILQFLMEFTRLIQCTGIVARDHDGKILHGRNYDFEFFEFQSKLTANVDFVRGDELIFNGDVTVGGVMMLTAMKPGKFMLNVNARHYTKEEETFEDIMNSLFVKNYIPSDFLTREVLLKADNYTDAIGMLKSVKITTPIYYIVSGTGPNEGCVIERNSEGVHGFYELNETNWFLVQTNYDRDLPDPPKDERRIPAQKRLNEIGQHKINVDNLFHDIMTVYPTLNVATIYTSTGIPETGYFNTTLFYGKLPYVPNENEYEIII